MKKQVLTVGGDDTLVGSRVVLEGEDVEESGITDIDEVAQVVAGKVTSGEGGEEDGGGCADTLGARDIVDERSPAPDGDDGGEVERGLLGLDEVPGSLLGEDLGGSVDFPRVGLLALLLEGLGGGLVPGGLGEDGV